MSPADVNANWSPRWTPHKHDWLRQFMEVWYWKARGVALKYGEPLAIVDGCSGTGRINGWEGSPLILRDAVSDIETASLRCYERHEATYARLREHVGAAAVCGDSLSALSLDWPTFGLFFYDPNPDDGVLPAEQLAAWGRRGRRDLLAAFSATNVYKRPHRHDQLPGHLDLLARTWRFLGLTEPFLAEHWTFIFATSYPALADAVRRRLDVADISTPEGAERVKRCSTIGYKPPPPLGQLELGI